MKTLLEADPEQFGKNYLAQYIWWPHINRQTYFQGIKCSQCTQTGKNTKNIIPSTQISQLPPLSELNEEINFNFAGPLDSCWGKNKYFLLCIDRFSKFSSTEITSSTSSGFFFTCTAFQFLSALITLPVLLVRILNYFAILTTLK